MTVAELIEYLSEFPSDLQVWTAIDDEGNGYNRLHYAPSVMYTPDTEAHRTDEMFSDDEDPEFLEGTHPVVVI